MKASTIIIGICIFLVFLLGIRLYGLWHKQDWIRKGSIGTVWLLGAYFILNLAFALGVGLSEPVKLNITNTLAEQIELYPVLFYGNTQLTPWADKGVELHAGQSHTIYVETEGSRVMWAVALDKTRTAVYLHRLDQGFMNEYKLMIQKNQLPDKRSAAMAIDAITASEGVRQENIAFTTIAVLLLTLLSGSLWIKPKNRMNTITTGANTG